MMGGGTGLGTMEEIRQLNLDDSELERGLNHWIDQFDLDEEHDIYQDRASKVIRIAADLSKLGIEEKRDAVHQLYGIIRARSGRSGVNYKIFYADRELRSEDELYEKFKARGTIVTLSKIK